MKKLPIIAILLLVIAGGVYALNTISNQKAGPDVVSQGTTDNDTLTISTSFYSLEFALTEIVGDLGVVTNIASGVDPHDFRPSAQDILTLQRSNLVVLHGAELEPWGEDVNSQLVQAGIPVVLATEGLDLIEAGEHSDEQGEESHDEHHEEEHEDEHHEDHHDNEHEEHGHEEGSHDEHAHGLYDPHTWLDPVLFAQTVDTLVANIVAVDPANADTYKTRGLALQTEILALDSEYSTTLANCALNEVITSHDAFGYIAARYGFEIHAIGGLSTQDTPSIPTLALLKEEVAEGIGAILLEESSITAYGETLSRETGLETRPINPISFLVPEGENYLDIMRSNLSTFAQALECNE